MSTVYRADARRSVFYNRTPVLSIAFCWITQCRICPVSNSLTSFDLSRPTYPLSFAPVVAKWKSGLSPMKESSLFYKSPFLNKNGLTVSRLPLSNNGSLCASRGLIVPPRIVWRTKQIDKLCPQMSPRTGRPGVGTCLTICDT